MEIPENIKGKLDIRPVKWIDEVLDFALERPPRPKEGAAETAPPEVAKARRRAAKRGSKPLQAH